LKVFATISGYLKSDLRTRDSQTTRDFQTLVRPAIFRQLTNMARKNPNIVITGTPGVGKTTHAEQLAQATGFTHLSVNQIVKDEGFHEGKDEETGSWVVDEDKVRILNTLLRHSHSQCDYSSLFE
jgi:MoxR-like ATPase